MSELLSVREAQEKITSVVNIHQSEVCTAVEAFSRVLAENIYSPVNLPAFSNSSMDGFAVHSQDLINSPVNLPVMMDIPAGFNGKYILNGGSAARIFTGAPVPEGADAVVPVEDTDQFKKPQNSPLPGSVTVNTAVKPGENIRKAGADLKADQLILKQGRVVEPQDVGLLISMGIRQVLVMKKARIALFSSGDELLSLEKPTTPGKIYDANRYALTGLIENTGGEVIHLGIARDNPVSVVETLDQALVNPPDLILGSAGVSVGAFDFVRQVIESNGSLSFWRVNMRPGKPIAFGSYKGIPLIGLPGNPVSAFVGCMVFVLPFIRKLHGLPPYSQRVIRVVLEEPLESADGRECYYRGIIHSEKGKYKARLTGHQGSGNLFSLVQANALLIVPAGVKYIRVGEEISAWALTDDLD